MTSRKPSATSLSARPTITEPKFKIGNRIEQLCAIPGLELPQITHPKLKGQWAESAFQTYALGLGFNVCQPWGDCAPFDFIIERFGRMSRVQVRSAWEEYKGHFFVTCTPSHPGGTTYTSREIDFMACLLVPLKAWYIIPVEALEPGQERIYFFPKECERKNARPWRRNRSYEEFRGRWELLA